MTLDAPWATPDHRRRVVRLCATLTGDAVIAEDLAQETFTLAWRLRERLVEPAGMAAWLDAIARNVCRQHRSRVARRLRHERPVADPEVVDEPAEDPLVDLLERDELVRLLDRALALLPAETRDALVARYVEGLLPLEIASRSGVSADAVSMRLLRGRTRLRHLLEDELAADPAARIWVGRHGAAWRPTRLRCAQCGLAGVEQRRDSGRGVIELRCSRCGPDVSAAYRLDNPTFAPILASVTRPSAVVARMAAWSAAYWPADGRGTVACTRCSAAVDVTTYRRRDEPDQGIARGWRAHCPQCGEEQTTSLAGAALLRPETRALRERRPATRAVPAHAQDRDGRRALVVGFRDDASGEGVDVVFSAGPDARLLAVATG